MKLWKVSVTVDVIVAYECHPPRDSIMQGAAGEIESGNGYCRSVNEIKAVADLPRDWVHSYPYGDGDASQTCGEILEAARLEAIRNAPMPNQTELFQ